MLKLLILLMFVVKIVSSIKLYRTMRIMKNVGGDNHVKIDRIEEIPIPKEDEVLLKMKCCGVCHTDLHLIDSVSPPKHAVGHEGKNTFHTFNIPLLYQHYTFSKAWARLFKSAAITIII